MFIFPIDPKESNDGKGDRTHSIPVCLTVQEMSPNMFRTSFDQKGELMSLVLFPQYPMLQGPGFFCK